MSIILENKGMWIFSKYGFFSIVQDRIDKKIYRLRARSREDLEGLRKACQALHGINIIEDPKGDYMFKIFADPENLKAVMITLGETIDYPNFKDSLYSNESQKDKIDSYHQIWDLMFEYRQSDREEK